MVDVQSCHDRQPGSVAADRNPTVTNTHQRPQFNSQVIIVIQAQIEFDLTVVAALLAVVGYSLNDTIVLFDRIRENFPRLNKRTSIEVINISVNETLSRTIMTSLTTLMVLIALFYFGGEIIHGFALTLIIGVVVGTYSSIYVASASLLLLKVSKFDLLIVEKEGIQLDSRP